MRKLKLYLDNCSFNRPFDNQSQIKIHLETEAKLHIQGKIKDNYYDLAWSYMLDYENDANPYEDKRNAIRIWKSMATIQCNSTPAILNSGREIEKLGISPKDALHIACALHSKCDYFITTDLRLLKKSISGIRVVSPIEFITETEVGS